MRTSGLEEYIIQIKASSYTVIDILQPNKFDFVYIDGDHAYAQFKRDLLNYTKVVKIGGIICGDDLEICPDEIDVISAKKYYEEDAIVDPKTKKRFHPSIALSVLEVFGNDISMKNGFWAMRRVKDNWESIIL